MPSQYIKKYPNGRSQVVFCQTCGKSFDVPLRTIKRNGGKYCSLECKYADQRNGETVTCEVCGKPFVLRPSESKSGHKRCSWRCRNIAMRGSGNGRWNGGDKDFRGHDWQEVRTAALARDGNRCTECGSTQSLLVHHIVPWEDSHDNSLSNLKTLCIGCHIRTHNLMDVKSPSGRYSKTRK